MRIFLTGGTGLLGSHVAEAAVLAGHAVRALARPTSDVRHLRALGVEIVVGDLRDAGSLAGGMRGCDVAIHSAARVGDWGTWRQFLEETVEASRRVYDAAVAAGVPRAVHISSVAVYGKRLPLTGEVVESQGPLPPGSLPRWYFYGRAKSLAESLAMRYHADGRLAIGVIRPGWIYGPRDRASFSRLSDMLLRGKARLIGAGSNLLSLTYAGNVADAVLLAAAHPAAVGEAFNVSNDEPLTQRQFLAALADSLGAAPPRRCVPYRLALSAAALAESAHRWLSLSRAPAVTRQGVMLLGLPGAFSTAKIRRTLGWLPRARFADGMAETARWWRETVNPAMGLGATAL